ncbi:4-hydroxybenzoate octaprenyltransferase [Oleisolibacter albus]|uniref:4-hydroxybenzoate octaprenyltransferase n=1 Tax=Oleisolibacter albus TaxID=2171757 RepID=UPI001EFE17F9|nr:4-hydroxybenzoate octaprenyltransferase [Oleisolibacter albus]
MTPQPESMTAGRLGHTDIRQGSWVDRWLPRAWRPYALLARLDRPIGTWLLLFPCWWSIALAAPAGHWPDLRLMALFALGAVVMRGAGCTVNDILDRKLDAQVERTRVRPIPSGAVTTTQALAFLLAQLLVGLMILLQLNPVSIVLGAASLLLVFTYPLMKRITWWPQAFLGLTFNWGALLGWAAVRGSVELPALLLYAGGILWTLGYDTIYAHQDKEDDARIGVRSTARLFGDSSKRWVGGFYVGAFLCWLAAVEPVGMLGTMLVPLAVTAALLITQVRGWDPDDPADSLSMFKASRFVGWALLIAIVAGTAAKPAPVTAGGGGPGDMREQQRPYAPTYRPLQLVSSD